MSAAVNGGSPSGSVPFQGGDLDGEHWRVKCKSRRKTGSYQDESSHEASHRESLLTDAGCPPRIQERNGRIA